MLISAGQCCITLMQVVWLSRVLIVGEKRCVMLSVVQC